MARQLGGNYSIGERLGRGGMGEVFRGTDQLGNEFAIKILREDLAGEPAVVSRFVAERSILVGVDDPHLVRVRDLVVQGETLAIVMDLVRGPDLRQAISDLGTVPPGEAARIGAGIAAGLAAVHAAGVVHRDVKPENVMLDRAAPGPPLVRLTDFGIARLFGDSKLARTTLLMGTPLYMAPELAEGQDASPASDLYALGIVLYELCCGVAPFAGGSVATVIRSHATMLPGRPAGVPDDLWDLIVWLLQKAPPARPQSARQVAAILDGLTEHLARVPAAPRLDAPPAPLAVLTTPTEGLPADLAPTLVSTTPPLATTGSTGAAGRRSRRGLVVTAGAAAVILALGGVSWAVFGGNGVEAEEPADPIVTETPEPSPTPTPEPEETPTPTVTPTEETAETPSAVPDPTAMPTTGTSASSITTMPSLAGLLVRDAAGALPRSVRITVIVRLDENAVDRSVLEQQPAPGATLADSVTLTVARKPIQIFLEKLNPVNGGWWRSGETVTMSARPYLHSVSWRGCSAGATEYLLGRSYRRLAFSLGINDDTPDPTSKGRLEVFADNRPVLSRDTSYDTVIPVDVDVTGILRLRLEWHATAGGSSCDTMVTLGEAKLIGVEEEIPEAVKGSS